MMTQRTTGIWLAGMIAALLIVGCSGSTPPPDVLAVHVPGIVAGGPIGIPDQQVQLQAELTGKQITSYQWTFSEGVMPRESTEAAPVITLGSLGQYTATLTVTNESGASAPFTFDFEVGPPVAPEFTTFAISENVNHSSPGIGMVDGKPVIAYQSGNGSDVTMAQATTATPTSAADWNVLKIANGVTLFAPPQVVDLQGVPAIGYLHQDNSYWFDDGPVMNILVARAPVPSLPAQFTRTPDAYCTDYQLMVIEDQLSMTISFDSSSQTNFCRAKGGVPASSSDWEEAEVAADATHVIPVVVEGDIVVVYTNPAGDLVVQQAPNVRPNQIGNWASHVVVTAEGDRRAVPKGFFQSEGRLGLAYAMETSFEGTVTSSEPRIAIGNSLHPASPGDWTVVGVAAQGNASQVLATNGSLVFPNPTNDGMTIVRSLRRNPGGHIDFQVVPIGIESGIPATSAQGIVLTDGSLLFTWATAEGDGTIKVGTMPAPTPNPNPGVGAGG